MAGTNPIANVCKHCGTTVLWCKEDGRWLPPINIEGGQRHTCAQYKAANTLPQISSEVKKEPATLTTTKTYDPSKDVVLKGMKLAVKLGRPVFLPVSTKSVTWDKWGQLSDRPPDPGTKWPGFVEILANGRLLLTLKGVQLEWTENQMLAFMGFVSDQIKNSQADKENHNG